MYKLLANGNMLYARDCASVGIAKRDIYSEDVNERSMIRKDSIVLVHITKAKSVLAVTDGHATFTCCADDIDSIANLQGDY